MGVQAFALHSVKSNSLGSFLGKVTWEVMPIFMETPMDTECAVTVLNRAGSQPQNTLLQHSLHYKLCFFFGKEQEPACCT